MRVVGLQIDNEGHSIAGCGVVSSDEENAFRRVAASPNVYERVSLSVAPSIYGFADVKKAISCLLFGGSRKR